MAAKKAGFEENMKKLQETIEKLEDEKTPLEEAFELYKEGMVLLKTCGDEIDLVEKKVKELKDNGEVEDFELPKRDE